MIPRRLSRIAADDAGATAVEYAVMLAMLILAVVAGISALGGANQAFWQGNVDTIREQVVDTR